MKQTILGAGGAIGIDATPKKKIHQTNYFKLTLQTVNRFLKLLKGAKWFI